MMSYSELMSERHVRDSRSENQHHISQFCYIHRCQILMTTGITKRRCRRLTLCLPLWTTRAASEQHPNQQKRTRHHCKQATRGLGYQLAIGETRILSGACASREQKSAGYSLPLAQIDKIFFATHLCSCFRVIGILKKLPQEADAEWICG